MGRRPGPVPAWLDTAAALAWRALVVAAGFVVLVLVLARLTVVVIPVIGGLFLSVVMVPPARWLRAHGWPALAATWAVFLFGLAVLVGLGMWLIPLAAHQLGPLRASLADSVNGIRNWLIRGPLHLSASEVDRYAREARDRLTGAGPGGAGSVIGGRLLEGAAGGFHFLAHLIATLALTIVVSFFFVKDGHTISNWIVGQFKPTTGERLRAIGARSWTTLSGYVRGTAVNGLVNAVIMVIGLSILHVPLVPAIAALTFVGGFFPIVGAFVSGAIAALVALVARGFGTALFVVLLTVVIHHVEGYLVGPFVLGRAGRLPALVILLALATGTE
ncbi:MAG: AI-2E family transporter, partial [Actinobacteria bacterium]|nr:AI-2E family transporter [Actinomycetota bacterium]